MKPVYQLEEDRVTGDDPTARVCRAGWGTGVVGEHSGLGEWRRRFSGPEEPTTRDEASATPPAPLSRRGYARGGRAALDGPGPCHVTRGGVVTPERRPRPDIGRASAGPRGRAPERADVANPGT